MFSYVNLHNKPENKMYKINPTVNITADVGQICWQSKHSAS